MRITFTLAAVLAGLASCTPLAQRDTFETSALTQIYASPLAANDLWMSQVDTEADKGKGGN